MRTFLLVLFLLSIQLISSQDYKSVDSIVTNYPEKFKTIKEFADRVSSDFKTDSDKTRAVYYWIAHNIAYDYKSANSVRVDAYHYNDESDLRKIQLKYAENVLKEKKAICEGYSQLLKYVLNELEVKCEVIEGYAKTDIREIGKLTNEGNHAWNAVFINNKWQLIDATWSTGNEENTPNLFDFNDAYFLIKPDYLIWSHFPDDKKWQLLEKPISKLVFFYSPIIHSGFYNSGIELTKMKGMIKSNRKIQLSFDSIDTSKTYYYQFTEFSSNLEQISFIKKGNKFIAEIPYTYKKGRELSFFNNFQPCLSFRIN